MTVSPRFIRITEDYLSRSAMAQMYRTDDSLTESVIFYVAEPWPWADDSNGEAYPSDIVAVRYVHSPTATDLNNQDFIMAVPSELPAGYTQSWLRNHLHSISPNSIPIANLIFPTDYSGISDLRIGTTGTPLTVYKIKPPAGGVTPYIWMPENRGNIAQYAVVTGTLYQGAGYRYIGADWLKGTGSDSFRFRFKRGATILYEFVDATVVPAGPAIRISSPIIYHDGGANDFYAPTDGTRETTFNVTYEVDTGGGYVNANAAAQDFHFISGPRLDIPLPFCVTGTTVHAPGGILTGSVPGY